MMRGGTLLIVGHRSTVTSFIKPCSYDTDCTVVDDEKGNFLSHGVKGLGIWHSVFKLF